MSSEKLVDAVRALVGTGEHREAMGKHVRLLNALRDALVEHDGAGPCRPEATSVKRCGCNIEGEHELCCRLPDGHPPPCVEPCRSEATPVVLTTSTIGAEGPELRAVDDALDLAGASRQWTDAKGTRPLSRAERIEWMRGRIWALEQERDALRRVRDELRSAAAPPPEWPVMAAILSKVPSPRIHLSRVDLERAPVSELRVHIDPDGARTFWLERRPPRRAAAKPGGDR